MDSSNKGIFSKLRDKMRNARKIEEDRKEKQEQEIRIKIVFTGESGTGAKTCFTMRYVNNGFSYGETSIGASFMIKNVVSRGLKVRLELWDTAGQVRFDSLLPMYFKGADGIVAGYDITSSTSIDAIREKLPYIRTAPPDAVIMVIGNKVDLAEERRKISWDEGEEFAREIGAPLFFETSAKTRYNVNESMEALIDKILEVKWY